VFIADLFRRDAPARYIEGRQDNHRPIYLKTEADWQGLFGVALNLSTPKLRTLAAKGVIASGEIGELTPSIYVTRRGRGYAIEMHSGAMRLIYSAARAMAATDSGWFREEKSPSLSVAEAAALIAELFKNYDEHKIATTQFFLATSYQKNRAETITRCAECFLLMHELAHIHNGDLAWWRSLLGIERAVHKQETAADTIACQWMIPYLLNPTPNGPQWQMFYAGAEFGLRVRMAMETYGLRFNNTHPPARDRVAAMRARLRAAAGPGTFYAIANPSIAFDQLWRAVELILKNRPPKFELGLDDVLAGLRVLTVEAVAAGKEAFQITDVPGHPSTEQDVFVPVNVTQERIFNVAKFQFRDISLDLRAAAKQQAGELFEPGTREYDLFLTLLALSEPLGSTP
jgi:hypothetical protein